jgi:PTH1 family peptidyl-tRNA hydrolase
VSFWRSLASACGLAGAETQNGEVAQVLPMKLVVGLGNHGSKYGGTRHNVGYEVIDCLSERLGPLQFRRQFQGRIASAARDNENVLLLKPETYMNLSGQSVQAAQSFYRLPPESLLIVCDDMNLPLGKLRIRRSGSDGGQKGLRSLAQHLGTIDYPRLRIGIGSPPAGVDGSDYVLRRFSKDEQPIIDEAVVRAADAVLLWCDAGIEPCMTRFN